jgi:unsaturated rhamnogalacturonyl hydrolase
MVIPYPICRMRTVHACRAIIVALAGALISSCSTAYQAAPTDPLSDWPAGASPREIGQRVAQNFASRPLGWQSDPKPKYVSYPEAVTWYGALVLADLTHDADLRSRLIQKFDALRTPEGMAHIAQSAHVDHRVVGAVPLEIFLLTGDSFSLAMGRSLADRQWENPTPDGITREARYWVDDMYMITLVQLQAYRATGDTMYLNRIARTMAAYLDSLQQPNGLLYHASDTPVYWGRGNGWAAAGMTELLRSMPAGHPLRAQILAGYRKMMAALVRNQSPEGLWRELIDKPEAWIETSGSGMFAFALVTGVREGWLEGAVYGLAARNAWIGLTRYLDADGNLREVCIGTNKASLVVGSDPALQYHYYMTRPRQTGDLHGQGPILWIAAALLR